MTPWDTCIFEESVVVHDVVRRPSAINLAHRHPRRRFGHHGGARTARATPTSTRARPPCLTELSLHAHTGRTHHARLFFSLRVAHIQDWKFSKYMSSVPKGYALNAPCMNAPVHKRGALYCVYRSNSTGKKDLPVEFDR